MFQFPKSCINVPIVSINKNRGLCFTLPASHPENSFLSEIYNPIFPVYSIQYFSFILTTYFRVALEFLSQLFNIGITGVFWNP